MSKNLNDKEGFKYLHSYNGNLYVWNCFVMVYSYQKENSKQNRQTRANQRRIKIAATMIGLIPGLLLLVNEDI